MGGRGRPGVRPQDRYRSGGCVGCLGGGRYRARPWRQQETQALPSASHPFIEHLVCTRPHLRHLGLLPLSVTKHMSLALVSTWFSLGRDLLSLPLLLHSVSLSRAQEATRTDITGGLRATRGPRGLRQRHRLRTLRELRRGLVLCGPRGGRVPTHCGRLLGHCR